MESEQRRSGGSTHELEAVYFHEGLLKSIASIRSFVVVCLSRVGPFVYRALARLRVVVRARSCVLRVFPSPPCLGPGKEVRMVL